MPESAVNALADTDSVPVLPWVPQTTAAVSLRLFEFDASIQLEKPDPPREEKEMGEYMVSVSFFLIYMRTTS